MQWLTLQLYSKLYKIKKHYFQFTEVRHLSLYSHTSHTLFANFQRLYYIYSRFLYRQFFERISPTRVLYRDRWTGTEELKYIYIFGFGKYSCFELKFLRALQDHKKSKLFDNFNKYNRRHKQQCDSTVTDQGICWCHGTVTCVSASSRNCLLIPGRLAKGAREVRMGELGAESGPR